MLLFRNVLGMRNLSEILSDREVIGESIHQTLVGTPYSDIILGSPYTRHWKVLLTHHSDIILGSSYTRHW